MEKKLYRDERRKVIAGVCAGLADYFNVDVSIVRLIFVLTLILKGSGTLIYIILWIVLPKRDYSFMPPADYAVPPTQPFGSPAPGYQQTTYQAPYQSVIPPRKGPSTAGIIGGIVLILLGAGFLIDELDLIPDIDFEQWWPVILVAVGLVLIFSGNRNKPVQPQWQQPETKDAEATEVKEDPSVNNSNETQP